MILLDTNVISEPLKAEPNDAVVAWLDAQHPEDLYICSITIAEVVAGIEVLPKGRKKNDLQRALDSRILPLFEGRILAFGTDAAHELGRLFAKSRTKGKTINFPDAAIAAIASVHHLAIATRNVKDFDGTDVRLINPWKTKV